MQRVINFSGGKTSAYMTISEYKEGDLVIFCDTGREHEKTYKFISDFETYENIPVIKISWKSYSEPFSELLKAKKFKVIPNRVKRFCTDELKIKTQKRYLRSLGIRKFENLIGFRADEEKRVLNRKNKYKNVLDKFPLYEKGINKQMVNEFWKNKNYTLEIPSILGNCDLCFMKGKSAIISILIQYPDLAKKWINDEEEAQKLGAYGGHTYFPDITYKQLLSIAQNNLFKDYNLDEINPAYNCACTT